MITFGIPDDPAILAAIGKVALRHGQLDYVLRMTVKSIEGLSIREALDATERQGSAELRMRVRKLAKKRIGEGNALVKLDALLTRSRAATERRNELLHGLWAIDEEGRHIFRHQGHDWQDIPPIGTLEALETELLNVARELNAARLDGFLSEALTPRQGNEPGSQANPAPGLGE